MKHHTSSRSHAFTLLEIMIGVAIIALLAVLSMPNLLRARKRSQATQIVGDLRIIDGAIDQYAIDNQKAPTASVAWEDVRPYIKKDSRLYNSSATDILGAYFIAGTVGEGVSVARTTFDALSDIAPVEFWSPYGIEP